MNKSAQMVQEKTPYDVPYYHTIFDMCLCIVTTINSTIYD